MAAPISSLRVLAALLGAMLLAPGSLLHVHEAQASADTEHPCLDRPVPAHGGGHALDALETGACAFCRVSVQVFTAPATPSGPGVACVSHRAIRQQDTPLRPRPLRDVGPARAPPASPLPL